jgi:signal transduction histidine kinase
VRLKRIIEYGAALTLILLLAGLAVVQYHWIEQLGAAERDRRERALHAAADQFRSAFTSELLGVCRALRPSSGSDQTSDSMDAGIGYELWRRTTRHPEMVTEILRSPPVPGEPWQRWSSQFRAWQNTQPPMAVLDRRPGRGGRGGPPDDPLGRGRRGGQFGPPPGRSGEGPPAQPGPGRGGPICAMEPSLPALLVNQRSQGGPLGEPGAILAVILNADYIKTTLLPDVTQRVFAASPDSPYAVDVVGPGGSVFRSEVTAGSYDLDVALTNMPGDPAMQRGEGLPTMRDREPWRLRMWHRGGALDAAVAEGKRRNLLFSFGALGLVAAGAALLMIAARRARMLARRQMDFVAGVSHELRTPLAVIRAAGDNLADGKIAGPERTAEYGKLIVENALRLGSMVDSVLQFAAGQSGKLKLTIAPVDVAALIARVLAESASLVESSGVRVESSVAANLPPVEADAEALRQCLHNLVSNAIKYGGSERWLGVEARAEPGRVAIRVSDRGIGIPAVDLARIFEPFYRSSVAREAQISGAGLGLSVVRDLMRDMNGSVDVESSGQGSTFTLTLQIAGGHR